MQEQKEGGVKSQRKKNLKPGDVQYEFVLPKKLLERVGEAAKCQDRSIASFIRMLLAEATKSNAVEQTNNEQPDNAWSVQ